MEQAPKVEGTSSGTSALSAGLGAWLPIETAPKDGTSILAWSPEYGQRQTRMSKYGKGSPGFAEWERGDGPLNSGWEWYEPRSGWISSWSPAYWMPLPEAPNAELSGPRPLAAEGSRSNDVLAGTPGGKD